MKGFKEAQLTIQSWLDTLYKENNFDEKVISGNFGLFEGTDGYVIYFYGSYTFNIFEEDFDLNDDYFPENKYLGLEMLSKEEWEDVLTNIEIIIKDLKDSHEYLKDLKHITLGFDEGDILRIR